MPIGSFSFNPPPGQLATFPVQVGVFLFDPNRGYALLPNIECHQVSYHEGHAPPTARFSYVIDNRAILFGFPSQFEQMWPLNRPNSNDVGQYTVTAGDRIVVAITTQNGNTELLFDGFPRLPQVDVAPQTQSVTFTAVGTAIRCWDTPITGRFQRDANDPTGETVEKKQTNLPVVFNPATSKHPTGMPNCTPDDGDVFEGHPERSYPIFIEELLGFDDVTNIDSRTYWTLSKVARYLLSTANDQKFVTNPDFTKLDILLDNYTPNSEFFDPADPSTFTANPIVVRTFDCTNHGWPDALERLLGYHNFGLRWILTQDQNYFPVNKFEIYRKDAANPNVPKQLLMPAYFTPIDPAEVNVNVMSAAFDYHGVANEFIVETALKRYEISVVLAADFEAHSDDYLAKNRKQFLMANLDGATEEIKNRYRRYIADECGLGHRPIESGTLETTPLDLSGVFPSPGTDPNGDSIPGYVIRLRPGRSKLITTTGADEFTREKSQLAFSRDYAGTSPEIWDGTGNWQPIPTGTWNLLEDRLGVYITASDVEEWHIGQYTETPKQEKSKTLRGIRSISNPGTIQSQKRFFLRLTTVIEGDFTIEAKASKRQASPLPNTIQRRIDAKDHWRYDVVTQSSPFYDETQFDLHASLPLDQIDEHYDANNNIIMQDDTKNATSFGTQMRSVHEFPVLPMSLTIPQITFAYAIGDRLSFIAGRDVSLQTNVGTNQGEAPAYPFVIGITWNFTGEQQSTVLQLSDRRVEPQWPNARMNWRPGWSRHMEEA